MFPQLRRLDQEVKVFTDTDALNWPVARWRVDIRRRNGFDLASLIDPSYDVGAYARIRSRGEGYGVRGSHHVVTVPSVPSEKLAVLYGLVCGDGYLANYATAARLGKWRIGYAESDPAVIEEYVRLTKEVFGVSPSVSNRKTWYEAYYCSKIVYRFYSRVLGHRTGRKTGSLTIPDSFRHDSRILFGFLRGLFTAEGSIKVERNVRIALEMQEPLLIGQMALIMKSASFHPHLYSYARKGRQVYGLYIYGLDETRLFRRIIGFGRKGLRLSKVISQFERRGGQPGKARWRSKTPPSVAVKHSNGARPIGPLDGSGSRSKEKKPADGRPESPNSNLPRATKNNHVHWLRSGFSSGQSTPMIHTFPALMRALKAAPLSRKAAPLSRVRSSPMLTVHHIDGQSGIFCHRIWLRSPRDATVRYSLADD
jgi:hypothetical protein